MASPAVADVRNRFVPTARISWSRWPEYEVDGVYRRDRPHQQRVKRNHCSLDRSAILCYQSGAQNFLVALWKPSLFGTFENALVT